MGLPLLSAGTREVASSALSDYQLCRTANARSALDLTQHPVMHNVSRRTQHMHKAWRAGFTKAIDRPVERIIW